MLLAYWNSRLQLWRLHLFNPLPLAFAVPPALDVHLHGFRIIPRSCIYQHMLTYTL